MILRFICLLASVLALTAPASGLAPAGGGADEPRAVYNAHEAAADRTQAAFGPDPSCPRNLDGPAVVVPVVDEQRLTGYAFVVPRVCLKRGDPFGYRQSMHVLADQLVRAGHRAPFQLDAEGVVLKDATHAAMLDALASVVDPEQVDRLDLLGEDVRYLR